MNSVPAFVMGPFITTVIPTYRRPELLRRAILSVLGQTYPYVRACVFDNASSDETEAVVTALMRRDPRIYYHRHHENIGPYPNFNFGMRAVGTPYFSLLSDDDVLAPDFYAQAMKAFQRYSNAMFVCMPTMVVDTALRVISPPICVDDVHYYEQGVAVKGMLEGTVPGTWTGIVFRYEVCDAVGLVGTTEGSCADGGFVYHVAARFPGVVAPGVAAVLMAHEDSFSGSCGVVSKEWISQWNSMMRRIFEDRNVPVHIQDYLREVPHPNYLVVGVNQVGRALVRGDFAYAFRVVQGVKECSYPLAGIFLNLLIWCCKYCYANSLLKQLHCIRASLQRRRVRGLDARHGDLVKFVREYTQGEV